jgi:hypothetical protein
MTAGFDAAHFAHRCQWTFRFNDQPGELHDSAAAFDHAGLTDLAQGTA